MLSNLLSHAMAQCNSNLMDLHMVKQGVKRMKLHILAREGLKAPLKTRLYTSGRILTNLIRRLLNILASGVIIRLLFELVGNDQRNFDEKIYGPDPVQHGPAEGKAAQVARNIMCRENEQDIMRIRVR